MSKHFSPDNALFKNEARTTGPEDPEQAFIRRKKKSLRFLLVAVFAIPVFVIGISAYNGLNDPYSYTITTAQSVWSTISVIAFLVAVICLFSALVVRIWAGIKR